MLKLEWRHGKGVSAELPTLPIAIATPWVTLGGNDRYEMELINRSTGWYKAYIIIGRQAVAGAIDATVRLYRSD
ncbi:hypothetical protein D3C73_1635110 [compost metagenome]